MTNDELFAKERGAKEKVFDLLCPDNIAKRQGIDRRAPGGNLKVLEHWVKTYNQLKPQLGELLYEPANFELEDTFDWAKGMLGVYDSADDNPSSEYLGQLCWTLHTIKELNRVAMWYAEIGMRSMEWRKKYELEVKRTEEARNIALKMLALAPNLKKECREFVQPELYPPGFYEVEADDQAQGWFSPDQINPN